MNVDRNEKIWAFSNTGNKRHAFVSPGGPGKLRAMCHKNTQRNANTTFAGLAGNESWACDRCVKLANAMWDRAEASMQPATEADDLGYVAPVGGRAVAAVPPVVAPPVVAPAEKPIPADMNRELLRQARAVAEAHRKLFPGSASGAQDNPIDAAHAEAIEQDEILNDIPGAPVIGQVFEKTSKVLVGDELAVRRSEVEVREVFAGYTDPWSRKKYDYGIRFELREYLLGDLRTSRHSLGLEVFQDSWMTA